MRQIASGNGHPRKTSRSQGLRLNFSGWPNLVRWGDPPSRRRQERVAGIDPTAYRCIKIPGVSGLQIIGRHLAGLAVLHQVIGDLLSIVQSTHTRPLHRDGNVHLGRQ
jgi:hypothetical protein